MHQLRNSSTEKDGFRCMLNPWRQRTWIHSQNSLCTSLLRKLELIVKKLGENAFTVKLIRHKQDSWIVLTRNGYCERRTLI